MNCLINFSVESELPRVSTVESETQIASKSTVGSKQKQREEKKGKEVCSIVRIL